MSAIGSVSRGACCTTYWPIGDEQRCLLDCPHFDDLWHMRSFLMRHMVPCAPLMWHKDLSYDFGHDDTGPDMMTDSSSWPFAACDAVNFLFLLLLLETVYYVGILTKGRA